MRRSFSFNYTRVNETGLVNVFIDYRRSGVDVDSVTYAVVEDPDDPPGAPTSPTDRLRKPLYGNSGTTYFEFNGSDNFDSENFTVTVVTEGASIEFNTTIRRDQDSDGLYDLRENVTQTFYNNYVIGYPDQPINTEVDDRDTDGDGLDDGRELLGPVYRNTTIEINDTRFGTSQNVTFEGLFMVAQSHPNRVDTDDDGLNDTEEVLGWNVSIATREVDGEQRAYRWAPAGGDRNMSVNASAWLTDTDGDRLSDFVEYNSTHTDPHAGLTYVAMADEHAGWIDPLREDRVSSLQAAGFDIDDITDPQDNSIDFSDSTMDFDFVWNETSNDGLNRLRFTALDGTRRSDTWFPNRKEVRNSTDPWDPDTDDDGLTDGQEVIGVTEYEDVPTYIGADKFIQDTSIPSSELNPADSDSDGDGYWDGWIGVYDVRRSDDVILYMEHLESDPGIAGTETVPQQIGYHQVSGATPGVDIFGNGTRYHSNIHLGELYWDNRSGHTADPVAAGSEPDLTLSIEVDRYENASALPLQLFDDVERNYGLYGLDVSFQFSQNLSYSDLEQEYPADDDTPPISKDDAVEIENQFHDNTSALYMFITTRGDTNPGDPLVGSFVGVEGVASSNGFNPYQGFGWGVLVFTEDHDPSASHSRANHLQKTMVHEIGHMIGTGRADDGKLFNPFTEVYSGSSQDETDEYVTENNAPPFDDPRWSVMTSGWQDGTVAPPMDGIYVAFSIEELSTVELEAIDTIEGG